MIIRRKRLKFRLAKQDRANRAARADRTLRAVGVVNEKTTKRKIHIKRDMYTFASENLNGRLDGL